jgi:hypothetical protein
MDTNIAKEEITREYDGDILVDEVKTSYNKDGELVRRELWSFDPFLMHANYTVLDFVN